MSRPADSSGKERRIKASYIGFGTDDAVEFYDMFVEAMKAIGIYDCMQITAGDIKTEPTKPMLAHLERSDVVRCPGRPGACKLCRVPADGMRGGGRC